MGLGTLRRYHARPDAGVTPETAVAPTSLGEAAEAALKHFESVSTRETEAKAAVDAWRVENPDAADADNPHLAEYNEAFDAMEAAKIALETAEAEAGKWEAEQEAARLAEANAPAVEPTAWEKAGLNRNSSTANWSAFALANGQTEETLKGLKRDDIAALFLGPKE